MYQMSQLPVKTPFKHVQLSRFTNTELLLKRRCWSAELPGEEHSVTAHCRCSLSVFLISWCCIKYIQLRITYSLI